MDHCEVGEAPRGDAQHAQVVVQRRRAVFDLDALLFVIHGADFCNSALRRNASELSGVRLQTDNICQHSWLLVSLDLQVITEKTRIALF